MKAKINGERSLVFEEVIVRTKESYLLEMHSDIDEDNACNIKNNDYGYIIL